MKKVTIKSIALVFSMLCLANGVALNAYAENLEGMNNDSSLLEEEELLNGKEISLYDEKGDYTVSYKMDYYEETIPVTIDLTTGVSTFYITLSLDEGYQVNLSDDGEIAIDDSFLSENFLIASSVSEDGKTICITGATDDSVVENGNSISFELINTNKEVTNVESPLTILPVEQNAIYSTNSVAVYGDVDGDGYINAVDASLIMHAYSTLNNGKAILTKHLLKSTQKSKYFFPNAPSPLCADCVQTGEDGKINVVTLADAQEILNSSAHAGVSSEYVSLVGTNVGALIDYSNVIPSTVTTVYECMLPVPHVGNAIINNVGTCWLATIVSAFNYKYKVNLTVNQVFNELEDYYKETPSGTTLWIKRANSYCDLWTDYAERAGDFVDVYGQLNYDNPIFMGTSNHAVVLCGIKIKSDGTGEYTIMDSNYSDYVTIKLNKSQMKAKSSVMVEGKPWANYYYYYYD